MKKNYPHIALARKKKMDEQITLYQGNIYNPTSFVIRGNDILIESTDMVGKDVLLAQFGKNSHYFIRVLSSTLPENIEAAKTLVKNPVYSNGDIVVLDKASAIRSGQYYADDLVEIIEPSVSQFSLVKGFIDSVCPQKSDKLNENFKRTFKEINDYNNLIGG